MPGEGSSFDVPPAAFGRYRVLHQIGAGSLGPVFRAEAPQGKQPVAIKILRVHATGEQAERIAGALRDVITHWPPHPALVELIDAGVHEGEAFLVTALAPGDSLDTALREFGPAAIVDALPRLRVLAEALDRGAATDLWHGDLQPRDIMVSADETFLLGLGVGPVLEREGIALPVRRTYTAPEVMNGPASSPASDQYALAAITHEWLFGRRILGPSDPRRVDVPQLPGVDRESLVKVLKRALATNPADRFASCREFVEAIGHTILTDSHRAKPVEAPAIASALSEFPLEVAPNEPVLEWTPPPLEAAAPSREPFSSIARPDKSPGIGVMLAVLLFGVSVGSIGGYFAARQAIGEPDPVQMATPPPPPAAEKTSPAAAAPVDEPVVPVDMSARTSQNARAGESPRAPENPRATESPRATPPPAKPAAAPDRPSASRTEQQARPNPVTAPPANARQVAPAAARATTLVIESRPAGATVTVDGRAVGSTPLTLNTVAPGAHTVRLERPGYRPWITTVHVTSGERARVAASLVGVQAQE